MNEAASTKRRKVTQTDSGLSVWKEASIVKKYLESLNERPSHQIRDAERQLEQVQAAIETEGNPAKLLGLYQRRIDLINYLEHKDTKKASEAQWEFSLVVKSYSDRRGISYAAWREVGVPAEVLKEAGIER